MPALTRDQFMAMQPRAYPPPLCESPPHPRPPALEDSPQWGYLSELISQPHSRKPSRCVTRQTSMDDTETMTDFGGRPNRLAPMPHYSTSPRSYKKNRLPKPISPISQIDCCEDPCSGESESEQGYDGRPPMINDVKVRVIGIRAWCHDGLSSHVKYSCSLLSRSNYRMSARNGN
eukprot:Blabericola_migrator_1__9959@NODE_5507_length_745_cov_224_110619_g209_i1_p1_GENE_NODE_5507_length_745_cov_224_110619_g209_i1NODE_5507_length_745_cov_224_110619_g209_i1_p1_ORF_typecomplete_len175_score15_91_NODE_5507_length_745_cov_224_110619_g209_i1211735